MNIIKLQVMFEWSFEWDCRGQISLPTGMGGKLKTPSSCTVPGQPSDELQWEKEEMPFLFCHDFFRIDSRSIFIL